MPRTLLATLATGLGFLAGAAEAGPLVAATWTQSIQGTDLTVTNSGATCSDTLPTHVQQTIICPTGGLGADGWSTSTSFNVSLTMPLFDVDQFTTGGVVPYHTAASLAGPAYINGDPGMATGGLDVDGMMTVKLAAHVMGSMYAAGGVGSTWFAPHSPPRSRCRRWSAAFPAGGVVTLVAPSKISIDGPLAQRRTVSFTSLKLTYASINFYTVHGTMVPEPGMLLLLGAGTACLLIFGRRAA